MTYIKMEGIKIKRRIFSLFLIFSIIFTGSPGLALEEDYIESNENELIVKFKEVDGSADKYSSLADDSESIDSHTRLIRVGDEDLDGLIEKLEKDPSIDYVERNYIYKQTSLPNDPYYHHLWHLDNIQAESAWRQVTCDQEELVVAVIDSGIDPSHPDLKNRIAQGGYNFLEDSWNIYDYNGHGSFVAGIISAEANNSYGITGLAGQSNIKVLPLLVSDFKGDSTVYDIVRAIDYSIEQDVDVINLSLGGPNYSQAFKDAIDRALRADIVVVAAAGNEALKANDIFYPASYEGVLSVGATDKNNKRADFSTYNDYLDLVAPGHNILSTSPASKFSYGSGSSYAGPMVSATAALLRGANPNLSVEEIGDILISTAEDLGSPGKDPYYGHGLVNMERAINLALERLGPPRGYEDFSSITAREDQVLRVKFNFDLDEESLDDNIFISSDPYGRKKDSNYSLEFESNGKNIVHLKARNTWDRGYIYLFINDRVRSIDGRQHRSKLRVKIFVE